MRSLSVAMATIFAACATTNDGGHDGSKASPSEQPEGGADGPPEVQFIGRFDTRDTAGPKFGWPGCRIRVRFSGTQASVDLNEIEDTWMDGAPSEWDVSVDGAWGDKIVTTPGKKTYAIASGLTAGDHSVELYKRSEAQNGVTQFLGFDFGGGTLLAPPPRSTRHIEVIGDSAAAGFGVEGIGYPNDDCPGLDYSSAWQNFRKSFGALLGESLDAELHGTVYSGKGMVKNIWRPDPDTMPIIFPLANPADESSNYDFAWKADVVVMMLGGNDFAEGQPDEDGGNGPATATEFTNAYRTFVAGLRDHYPNAHIFLTTSPSVSDAEPAGRSSRTNILDTTSAIAKEHNADGDAKVYAFAPKVATPQELTACNGHGTPAFHERVAAELATIVKEKTGW